MAEAKYVSERNLAVYTQYVQGMADGKTIECTKTSGESAKTFKVGTGIFTDSASDTSGVSSKLAATPACVDAKMSKQASDMISQNASFVERSNGLRIQQGEYANFSSSSDFNVSGFTRSSDGLVVSKTCIALIYISFSGYGTYTSDVTIKSGSDSFKLKPKGGTTALIFLAAKAGEKIQIYVDSTYIDLMELKIQGV